MSTYISLLTQANRRPKRAIFEIGGHDGTDSVLLNEAYRVPVYAFEPNPDAIERWQKNAGGRKDVHLIEKAVCEEDGSITFFAVDTAKYENIGASSLSRIDFSKRSRKDPDRNRGSIQNEITVPSTRLDTFIAAANVQPDVVCLDCQESELRVLKSMGDAINLVDTVVAECTFTPTYEGGCTFPDVEAYLQNYGLHFITSSRKGGKRPRKSLWSFVNPKFSFFDVVFGR
jgi:FkbM family methyltransferase